MCWRRRSSKSHKMIHIRLNRIETHMAKFDDDFAVLLSKVDVLLTMVDGSDEEIAEARAAQAAAEEARDAAQAERDAVIAQDAADDEAADNARAQQVSDLSARIDARINPPAPE